MVESTIETSQLSEAIRAGQLHQLISDQGLEMCKSLACTKHERLLVEIAAEMMAEDSERMGISHSGFCLTALPHRDPKIDFWKRDGHKCTLIVQAGRDRSGEIIGLPFGPKARLILLYLQTAALRTGSRMVELGNSMNDFLGRMGVSGGGKQYSQVGEQAKRISSCGLTFFYDKDVDAATIASLRHNGRFVKNEISFSDKGNILGQDDLFKPIVELDEVFFAELVKHPVPLWEPAIRKVAGKSMALDIYVWLAYRLHSLPAGKPTLIRWSALYSQFGAGFKTLRQWKPDYLRNLELAYAAYPGAQIEVVKDGLMLRQSPSPIPVRGTQMLALPGGKAL